MYKLVKDRPVTLRGNQVREHLKATLVMTLA